MWMASFNNHTRIDNQSHIDAAETTTNNQPNVVSLELQMGAITENPMRKYAKISRYSLYATKK